MIEYGDDDIVARVDVTRDAPSEAVAVADCARLAALLDAEVHEIVQAPEGAFDDGTEFDVRLLHVEPLGAGESAREGLARVNEQLLRALQRTEEIEPDHPRRMCSVSFVDEDGLFTPAGTFLSTMVHMGDVPDEHREWLIPEYGDEPVDFSDWEPGELEALARSMAWGKEVLVGWSVGWDAITAREKLRELTVGVGHEVYLAEPEPVETGGFRVWAVLGMSDDPAAGTFAETRGMLPPMRWEVVAEDDRSIRAEWVPAPPPEAGFTRLELRIGTDLKAATDGSWELPD